MTEVCAWCWKSLGKQPIETTDGAGGALAFCDDDCRREYRSQIPQPGDPPPPPGPELKPAYGMYHEFDTCEWCWKPANKVGWLGGVKAPYTLPTQEPAGKPLPFCDEVCAQWWKQYRCSRSAVASREVA